MNDEERTGEFSYDAILVTSFGGPERREDVISFLENVLRGKNVPRERMLQVAEHYYEFGGKSPINEQNRSLVEALQKELSEHGPDLPVYWGNRNWHPMLEETLAQMKKDGVRRALAFVTSAYSSYSGCRQYRENIATAQATVGEDAPVVNKIRVFHNHPGFIEALADRVLGALRQLPAQQRTSAQLVYTAHSIPTAMAHGCSYAEQLQETGRLVAERLGREKWRLVYQSRSGPATQPWLEPDVLDYLRDYAARHNDAAVVVVPIGFISDHMEVVFDLDTQAKALCDTLGLTMVRAATVGTHPAFIRMIRELINERMNPSLPRQALGALPVRSDFCPVDCCLPGAKPAVS